MRHPRTLAAYPHVTLIPWPGDAYAIRHPCTLALASKAGTPTCSARPNNRPPYPSILQTPTCSARPSKCRSEAAPRNYIHSLSHQVSTCRSEAGPLAHHTQTAQPGRGQQAQKPELLRTKSSFTIFWVSMLASRRRSLSSSVRASSHAELQTSTSNKEFERVQTADPGSSSAGQTGGAPRPWLSEATVLIP